MEGSDSDSDAPFDINSFLELAFQAEIAPKRPAPPPAPRPKARPRPQVNGTQEQDPLLISQPTKQASPMRKPANRPEITFVDVAQILEPPKFNFQPRLPPGITLTRRSGPVPSTNSNQMTNSIRPQFNPRVRPTLTRPQLNSSLTKNVVRPQFSPRLPNNALRFRLNPLAANVSALRMTLTPRGVNNPARMLFVQNQLTQMRQLNPRQMNPRHINVVRQIRPQLNPRFTNTATRVTFDPSKINLRQLNPRQFNPRQIQARQLTPHQLNPRLPNPRLANTQLANPRIANPLLLNPRQLNTRPVNPIRIELNPRFSTNNNMRSPLNSKQVINGMPRLPIKVRPISSNVTARVGVGCEVRPSNQTQAMNRKLYQETMNAIRARTGVTLVPLGQGPAGMCKPVTAGMSSQSQSITSINPAATVTSARATVKTEPGLKRKRTPEEDDNTCNICLKNFYHKKSLRRHMARAHKNVMNELPARKSKRISTKDSAKSMIDDSNSEGEEEEEEDVEIIPTPEKKPSELVNLSDEDEDDDEDEDSGMIDIYQFLAVSMDPVSPQAIQPVVQCPGC